MTAGRAGAVRRLADEAFDVLVVGGGITGAGVALDAAARGWRVALVEKDDFAAGTSSRSSKFVHGGLRYLQQGDVRLVYEALRERHLLLRNAPHLVHVLPFCVPMFRHGGTVPRRAARLLGTAMWLYDLTGGARIGRLHRRLSAAETAAHLPVLRADGVAYGYLYFDAAADDARLTLAVVRTAARAGAVCVNGAGVTRLSGGPGHRLATVSVDGEAVDVRCRAVVNATGVWADSLAALDGGGGPASIRQAKGVHLMLPRRLLGNDVAVILPVPRDRRSIFVAPWGDDRSYVGTTDTDDDGPTDHPAVREADAAYLLGALNAHLREPVRADDVVGSWAGYRPLVRTADGGRTADLSRRHRVTVSPAGTVSVIGGKLTTYRSMAADTVDAVQQLLGERRGPCRTRRLALVGAPAGPVPAADRLAGRYGTEAADVRALAAADPRLAEPLVPGLAYLKAEAVWAVRAELARGVDDVLSRRTRATLEDARAAAAAADVAELLAPELGWSAQRQAAEAATFRAQAGVAG